MFWFVALVLADATRLLSSPWWRDDEVFFGQKTANIRSPGCSSTVPPRSSESRRLHVLAGHFLFLRSPRFPLKIFNFSRSFSARLVYIFVSNNGSHNSVNFDFRVANTSVQLPGRRSNDRKIPFLTHSAYGYINTFKLIWAEI